MQELRLTVAYYFCNHRDSDSSTFLRILQNLVHDILRTNLEMIPVVHQLYVQKASLASTSVLTKLLRELATSVGGIRVVIDGLDECDKKAQADVIKMILDVRKTSGASFKAMISSRNLPDINKQFRTKTEISLYQRTDQALQIYIKEGVQRLRESFRYLTGNVIDRLEKHLLKKAGGWECPTPSSGFKLANMESRNVPLG
jgi:ATP/maltotriose-dependent transcriptional regulator MalT